MSIVPRLMEHWRALRLRSGQALLDSPLVRLELQRIRRKRWWPGRRFFTFYPALLGAALGYGVILTFGVAPGAPIVALVTGVPAICLLNVLASLLAFALAWTVPALTAASIARERELGTLDLLRATLLSERSLVLGKLGGCLVRLWPGLLTLALLTPFQIALTTGSSLPTFLSPLAMNLMTGAEVPWAWLLLAGLIGSLGPWGQLALHAAVGLFVSALARSSGTAVALSYGAIIAARIVLWMMTYLVGAALMLSSTGVQGAPEPTLNELWTIPILMPLGTLLLEFAGAALLVWGAIWWLKRV